MIPRLFVVAGDYRQYRGYLDRAGILPSEARYIGEPTAVHGVRSPVVMCVGTYYARSDWPAILRRLNAVDADLQYPDGN
jgi:hypothetical protein